MVDLGLRIKEVRKKNKLTQQQFGDELGISQTHVSKIEKNIEQPSETLLRFIGYKYVIDVNWLKTGEGNPMPTSETSFEMSMIEYNKARYIFEEYLSKLTNSERWNSVYMLEKFVLLAKIAESINPLERNDFLEDLENLFGCLYNKFKPTNKEYLSKDEKQYYKRQFNAEDKLEYWKLDINKIIELISNGLTE